MCGIFCCECDDEPMDFDEETYEHLSSRRRQELDNLRSIAILRRLARFTLSLREENMMKKLPDTDSQRLEEDNPGEISTNNAGSCSSLDESDDFSNERSETSGEVEMGNTNATNASADITTVEEANETDSESKYTHVLIHHPSYDIDGKQVKELEECTHDGEEHEKKGANLAQKIFRRKTTKESAGENGSEGKGESEEKCATDSEDEANEKLDLRNTEKREVPIFCAVCLMEYETSERVCWSSNGECTHVFHEDCILQWLVSLGRKRSKRQSFPRNPSDKRLLDYDLACPCCRQDFISKNLVLASAPEGDENV